jgi:hypothetical protein
VQNHLGVLHFSQSLGELVGVLGILVAFELHGNSLYVFALIVLEVPPLISKALEKQVKHFIEESEDHSFRVSFINEGISSYRFVGHLNVTNLVVVGHRMPCILLNAGETFPHHKFE